MSDDNAQAGQQQANDEPIKKLQFERDSERAKAERFAKELNDLKGRMPSQDDLDRWRSLEEAAAKADEERAKKAGEFDGILKQRDEKFERERKSFEQQLAERDAKAKAAESELERSMIASEFGSATDWFGGETARTILKPTRAHQILGDHVKVETYEDNGRTKRRVIVTDLNGEPIYDTKTRQPASFSQAIGELIEMLPDKNDILRGSGRTGSGSSGGTTTGSDRSVVDVRVAQRADVFRDPKAVQQMKDQMDRSGGLQSGPGWDRARRRTS